MNEFFIHEFYLIHNSIKGKGILILDWVPSSLEIEMCEWATLETLIGNREHTMYRLIKEHPNHLAIAGITGVICVDGTVAIHGAFTPIQ